MTLSVALVAGLSAIAWRLGQRAPFVAMGWFWFLGTLVPVIGIVQVGNQPMADRYDYFPSIGIFIAVTWGLAKFLTAFAVGRCSVVIGDEKAEPNRTVMVPDASTLSGCSAWGGSGLALVVAVGTLAMCVARTRQQLTYWADSETLFRHTVAITKNNSIALDNLGLSLLNQGKPDEAMEYYNAALRIHPKDPIARDGTGCCYFQKGQLEEAISNFKLGLEISTNQPTTFFNLGSALAQLGHFEEAIPYFEATLQLEPDDPDAYLSLGNVNYRLQRFNEAAAWFGRAVQGLPEDSGAHRSLSACLFAAGRFAEAETECERVLKLAPDDLRIRTLLARILMQQNRPEDARRQLDVVLRYHTDYPEARELRTSLGP